MRAVFCVLILLGGLVIQPAFAAHDWAGGGRFAETGFRGGGRGGPPPRMQRPLLPGPRRARLEMRWPRPCRV